MDWLVTTQPTKQRAVKTDTNCAVSDTSPIGERGLKQRKRRGSCLPSCFAQKASFATEVGLVRVQSDGHGLPDP